MLEGTVAKNAFAVLLGFLVCSTMQKSASAFCPTLLTTLAVRDRFKQGSRLPSFCRTTHLNRAVMLSDNGSGPFSGFFSGMFGGVTGADREVYDRVLASLSAPQGWSVNCQIGSEIARSLGGSGQLAKGDVMTVNIGTVIRLGIDEGYDPPQGSVFIESESAFFSGESFWSVAEDTDSGVPTAIQASLKCPEGIKISGEIAVPPGEIFLNFKVDAGSNSKEPGDVNLSNGRVTVKEDVKTSFLLTAYDGLLAEFKIIGTCTARLREERVQDE